MKQILYELRAVRTTIEQTRAWYADEMRADLEPLEVRERELEATIVAQWAPVEGTKTHAAPSGERVKIEQKWTRKVVENEARIIMSDPDEPPAVRACFVKKVKSEITLDLKAWRLLDESVRAALVEFGVVSETPGPRKIVAIDDPAEDVDGVRVLQGPNREIEQ